jgi:hypothetical protein
MDLTMLVLHLYVVGNFLFQFQHLLVVAHQDVLQNLDEQNQVALLPYLDEVLPFLLDVVVDAELRHPLRMDYYQDVVDAELRHPLRMDYYQDVEPLAVLVLQMSLSLQPLLHPVQVFQHLEMPSALPDRRRVRRQVLQQVLDLLRQSSSKQRSSSLPLSLLASSPQLALHRDRAQLICGLLVLQLLMMLNGRIRPFLGALQGLPCSPYRVVLPTHVRGPLTHFSCLGPHKFLWDASPSCSTS